MVARARLGLFSVDDARSAPPDLLKVGFEGIDGGWRAKLELRKMTRFDVGDLLQMQPRPESYDLSCAVTPLSTSLSRSVMSCTRAWPARCDQADIW